MKLKFYFNPIDENLFKEKAIGNFVRTLIFNERTNEIHSCYSRKVNTKWRQTIKNNIESDHRVKELSDDNYQIYSWVVTSELNLELPDFNIYPS